MPSRFLTSVPPIPSPSTSRLPPAAAAISTVAAFSFLFFLVVCLRKITRKRTAPESPSKPPYRIPYSALRRATDSFAAARRLGQGGFGPVFRGSPLPKLIHGSDEIAVKVMDSGSIQGEREFQNELLFASAAAESPYVVSLLGFSSDRKRRRMLLVYEFMPNGNLQDALLHRKCPELFEWKRRFSVAVDIARGLEFLHGLDQPIIHGDVKPSNVLLDLCFSAKIGDFGLARLKLDVNNQVEIAVEGSGGTAADDYGSVVETESVATAFEDSNLAFELSPEPAVAAIDSSPASVSPEIFDKASVSASASASATPSPEVAVVIPENGKEKKDWWLRQDGGGGGGVKDYVREWIGTEIKTDRPKSNNWIGEETTTTTKMTTNAKKNKSKKQLEWWIAMDEEKEATEIEKSSKKEKRRPAREWWKEEYCDELAKKKKKKMKQQEQQQEPEEWWSPRDDEMYAERTKKKKSKSQSRSRSHSRSRSSLDWWLEGLSGGGETVPRSGGGYSSTPSMRGTVCYVAPETGFGENPSEKCDVYSFGVTLLVLIAGRRPLQVTSSPASEYHRANLLSWARRLARAGKLADLVDKNIKSLDRDQAVLCITVALLCLQKIPARRPTMKEVVAMLTSESEPPQLPADLSPSRLTFKSNKKVAR